MPKLFFREVGLHGIEQGACKDDFAGMTGLVMVKDQVPWVSVIGRIERHFGVITDKAMAADIIPKLPADFRREALIGHPGAEIVAPGTINGRRRKDRPSADAALLALCRFYSQRQHGRNYRRRVKPVPIGQFLFTDL